MAIKSVEGRVQYTKNTLRGGKTVYTKFFGVDHRADPADVMSEVNDILKQLNINIEFVHVNDGSDAYWFGAVAKTPDQG